MVGFIDAHRNAYGFEPICAVLPIGPSTYFDHLAKRADQARRSDRACRDDAAARDPACLRREPGRQRCPQGLAPAAPRGIRCRSARTVARLMKDMGIQGTIRGKPHRTTIPDKKAPCPLDKVNRQFRVPARNVPWGRPSRRHRFKPYGRRFHLRRHLERVRLCRLRHRRLSTEAARCDGAGRIVEGGPKPPVE